MNKPLTKISVVVPVYNAQKWLDKCIESVLRQKDAHYELILVDDKSTDDSLEICRRYASKDQRVRVIEMPYNQGVACTRNAGITNSNGDIITFIDSDDCISCGYLRDMEKSMTSDVDLIMYGVDQVSANGTVLRKYITPNWIIPHDKIGYYIDRLHIGFAVSKAYKREIIIQNQIKFREDFSRGEDTLFVYSYLNCIKGKIITKRKCYYHYLMVNSSSLSNHYVKDIDVIYSALWEAKKKLERFSPYKVPFSKLELITVMSISNMYSISSPLSSNERIKTIRRYMSDPHIKRAIKDSNTNNNRVKKLIKIMFYINSPILFHCVFSLGAFIRNLKRKKL